MHLLHVRSQKGVFGSVFNRIGALLSLKRVTERFWLEEHAARRYVAGGDSTSLHGGANIHRL